MKDFKNLISYIKENEYLFIDTIINEMSLKYDDLIEAINEFNKQSYYYKIKVENNILYWIEEVKEGFANSKKERTSVLKQLFLIDSHKIDELEVLFGRDKKTLYKDIQKIKKELIEDFEKYKSNDVYFFQNILNNIDSIVVNQVQNNKDMTTENIEQNICYKLEEILGVSIVKKVIKLRVPQTQKYQKEASNLTNDIFINIQRYLKKKIVADDVKHKLYIHIQESYWRYKHMVFENKINVKKIAKSYINEYYQISTVIKMIFKSHKLYYNEEEIFYISLYFLNIKIYKNIKVKVCSSKESKRLMIVNEINKNFKEFDLTDNNEDIIITDETPNGAIKENCYIIKFPFDVYDIRKISKVLKYKKIDGDIENLFFKLLPVLKVGTSYTKFKSMFEQGDYISARNLHEYLEEEFIQIKNLNLTWEESIFITAKVLEKKYYINHEYIDNIIKLVQKYNKETIIFDNVALVHAPISNSVRQSGFSFLLNKKPILFPQSKKVNLVILFCANNEIDLLLALQDLNEILQDKDRLQRILTINKKEYFIEEFK